MRRSLLASVLESVEKNARAQSVAMFELGPVFEPRQNALPEALALVNAVRTQCASPLNEPVACLPALTLADVPTQAAMLAEILRQRRYELYLQAVRWSDLRRFGQPVKYQFMPVPTSECDRNQSAPC